MDGRTEEALASLKARLLTAKRTKADTLGVPPYVLQGAADTIERLQKDLDENSKQRARLEGKVSEEHELYLKYYDLGHNCSIQLRSALEERDALQTERDLLKAEVERLKGELAEASGQIEWLDKSNNLLRNQIESST